MSSRIAEIIVIIGAFVSVVVACFWLFPANNGISGEWFQATAAGTLSFEGLWQTLQLRKNKKPWLRTATVTALGIGLCIAAIYNLILS
ncbi:hypothetical protein [Alteromonas gilva]|uniref:Uncharacterized protein n=1 Tax=Alteromonas gilva TaxID=2987522 RepID=A0ABT5L762_9ALTE|nr:hypothetical protein [Alteromonas gilva]MDC8832909.1 hypothetical protein [Alteromonas gilva]